MNVPTSSQARASTPPTNSTIDTDLDQEIPELFDTIQDADEVPDDLLQGAGDDRGDETEVDDTIVPRTKRKKKLPKSSSRQRWTLQEEQEVYKYLREFVDNDLTPGQRDCEKAMAISKRKGGVIWKRARDNIKRKVNNILIARRKRKE